MDNLEPERWPRRRCHEAKVGAVAEAATTGAGEVDEGLATVDEGRRSHQASKDA